MGRKNILIEGISGSGKTTVATELERRGYHVIHGDRHLSYRGDPETGEPVSPSSRNFKDALHQTTWEHQNWIWDIGKVQAIASDENHDITFFCGGSRNFGQFIHLMDHVFILDVPDIDAIHKRMDDRVAKDPTDWGGEPDHKELVKRLHATKEDIPQDGIVIDSTQALEQVVDQILERLCFKKSGN